MPDISAVSWKLEQVPTDTAKQQGTRCSLLGATMLITVTITLPVIDMAGARRAASAAAATSRNASSLPARPRPRPPPVPHRRVTGTPAARGKNKSTGLVFFLKSLPKGCQHKPKTSTFTRGRPASFDGSLGRGRGGPLEHLVGRGQEGLLLQRAAQWRDRRASLSWLTGSPGFQSSTSFRCGPSD